MDYGSTRISVTVGILQQKPPSRGKIVRFWPFCRLFAASLEARTERTFGEDKTVRRSVTSCTKTTPHALLLPLPHPQPCEDEKEKRLEFTGKVGRFGDSFRIEVAFSSTKIRLQVSFGFQPYDHLPEAADTPLSFLAVGEMCAIAVRCRGIRRLCRFPLERRGLPDCCRLKLPEVLRQISISQRVCKVRQQWRVFSPWLSGPS